MQYFLDTSVIMYAAGGDHAYKEPSVRIIDHISRNELEAVVSTEVLQEILHRYVRLDRTREGIGLVRKICELVSVLPVDETAMHTACDLLAQYKVDARDAIHAAVALHCGITAIISADTHFDLIREITRVDPMQLK